MRLHTSYISLHGLRFRAFHGVLPQERATGGDYIVDVRVEYNVAKAMSTDDVSDTLDYAGIYAIVSREMRKPSNLIEHVAGRVGESILAACLQASGVHVTVTKKNPPMGADCDGASVEIHLTNDK